MTTTYRKTKTGRLIIENDGFDSGFNALMIGAKTGKVSLPQNIEMYINDLGQECVEWSDNWGIGIYRGTLAEAFYAAVNGEIPGARCFNIGSIE